MDMNKSERDLLIEISTKLGAFKEEWDNVMADGFKFCAPRKVEIENIKTSVTWLRNTLFALIFIILTATVGSFWEDKDASSNVEEGRHISNIEPNGTQQGNKILHETSVKRQ